MWCIYKCIYNLWYKLKNGCGVATCGCGVATWELPLDKNGHWNRLEPGREVERPKITTAVTRQAVSEGRDV